ncbi:hypothetical protein AWM75_02035 [Aerococcus urinaehominis]|uniref:GTP cyclohydrolase 1 type 2 homolog n=1 Tax=Aerococcus urinaehominis TaxID=128944 RepID=A0A120IAR0_9LACT|nr:Nif3-like dinuclear metal center hexameric protein [Aerococcus urinaehominis]AMB98845.1 hypothetical protein AWM75_02035 [Aerococcus urinaehominis]SDM17477.1 dinuclear metal center protein, YbgI/SA1388 family [Aerococcus urinaehominis]
MTFTVADFIERFERFAPPTLAVSGDPIGLHFGSRQQAISKILVTLDVRPEVVDEAIDLGVDFIFAHHPPIFRPASRLDQDQPQQAMYNKIIQHGIAVYAAHTNLDAVAGGMNDWLSDLYEIRDTEILNSHTAIPYYRVTTYVPTDDLAAVKAAIFASGITDSENYANVAYQHLGIGTFKPQAAAQPARGQLDQQEKVNEVAFSFVCSKFDLNRALATIQASHPYEEAVTDVVTLENMAKPVGIGRVGNLEKAMPLADYAQLIKEKSNLSGLRLVVADPDRPVKRVAVLGGAGEKYYQDALAKGADTFITGDVYYHTAHDMQAAGLNVIDPGHHFESICKPHLLDLFKNWQAEDGWPVEIFMSQLNTDPFSFV